MSCIQALQHIYRFSSSNFTYNYSVRPHSECRPYQITDCHRSRTCHIRHLCLKTYQIFNATDLQLGIIFNRNQTFILRNILRNSTKKCCFSAARTTANYHRIPCLHKFLQKFSTFFRNTVQRNQFLHGNRIIRKSTNCQNWPIEGYRINYCINPRSVFQSRIHNRHRFIYYTVASPYNLLNHIFQFFF